MASCAVEADRDDPEVDVGRQPAVQPNFLMTEMSPAIERRVVEKAVVNRPLQLPDLVICDEDPGAVRGDQTYRRRSRRGVRLRSRQVLEKSLASFSTFLRSPPQAIAAEQQRHADP